MVNLTATELQVLNNLSRVRNPAVMLGSELDLLIKQQPKSGTPVNAVNASATLEVSGVVLHGETVTIDDPLVSGSDVYEFLADEAQEPSDPDNIPVDIFADTTQASVVLTLAVKPTAGDKMTLGSKEYTFVPVGTDTADGEISIGTDLATAKAAVIAAINGTDEFNVEHPLVKIGAFAGNDATITAKIGGVAGNSIASTEIFTSGSNVFADTSLDGGVDCSAADAIVALNAAVAANDTQGVDSAEDTEDVLVFSAAVAGEVGNDISVSTDMSNADFADDVDTLVDGVDGTVGQEGQLMFDATYFYICTLDNAISGKNWKRWSNTAASF
jgi:hypothetical protein